MKNRESIQARYMRDPLPVRLGGLAANLARVESFAANENHGEVVKSLIEESKYFIEWTATDADLNVQIELVKIQRQLAQWQHDWLNIWGNEVKRKTIMQQAGAWSKSVLASSGLLR